MLDGGCSTDFKVVKKFIEDELNKSINDLKLVVITHAHPDHSGGAAFYKKYGIKLAAPINVNDWYKGVSGIFTFIIDLILAHMVAFKKSDKFKLMFFKRKIDFDYALKENDPLPMFDDWKVIEAKGHTCSDISLLHNESKIAYIADNIISSKNKFFRPYPIYLPIEYKNTIKKYIDLEIQKFLLAHFGEKEISKNILEGLVHGVSVRPRSHRTALLSIFKQFVKSIFK